MDTSHDCKSNAKSIIIPYALKRKEERKMFVFVVSLLLCLSFPCCCVCRFLAVVFVIFLLFCLSFIAVVFVVS